MELITLANQILDYNKKLILLGYSDDSVFFPKSIQVFKGHEICLNLKNDFDLTIDTKEKHCVFKVDYIKKRVSFSVVIDIPTDYDFIKNLLIEGVQEMKMVYIKALKEKKSYQIYKITNKLNGKCNKL